MRILFDESLVSRVSWVGLLVLSACEVSVDAPESTEPSAAASQQRLANTSRGNHGTNGDYDGDGRTDYAVFQPRNSGNWRVRSSGVSAAVTEVQWGLPNDISVPADYDGDGLTDIAVFRPGEGNWYTRFSSLRYVLSPTDYYNLTPVQWGLPGDTPVPGDYNGDGFVDRAVFRPSDRNWYLNFSAQGLFFPTQGLGPQPAVHFGEPNDVPVPGDYDGNGTTDLAVFRPGSPARWILRDPATGGELPGVEWESGVIPVPGDYDNDGATDMAVFDPRSGNWRVRAPNGVVTQTHWGEFLDVPVPGDYDGDSQL
ncbi:MAG TPA: VCBS repeat-containing protein, partial [Polyangiaceae bacterium]|nr:VCBS repeat-containing protein [Polyangiaceae bacterium]